MKLRKGIGNQEHPNRGGHTVFWHPLPPGLPEAKGQEAAKP